MIYPNGSHNMNTERSLSLPSEKASILLKALFSPPPQVDLSDTKDYHYNQDLATGEITRHE